MAQAASRGSTGGKGSGATQHDFIGDAHDRTSAEAYARPVPCSPQAQLLVDEDSAVRDFERCCWDLAGRGADADAIGGYSYVAAIDCSTNWQEVGIATA